MQLFVLLEATSIADKMSILLTDFLTHIPHHYSGPGTVYNQFIETAIHLSSLYVLFTEALHRCSTVQEYCLVISQHVFYFYH